MLNYLLLKCKNIKSNSYIFCKNEFCYYIFVCFFIKSACDSKLNRFAYFFLIKTVMNIPEINTFSKSIFILC